jgi:2-dehydropantoate 2-reductase
MKIGVVGCGAVGGYYGAMLARAGHDLHFLLRSDYEVVRRKGFAIQSARGDFVVRPHCARTPEEVGACDLVLVALKTTANDQFSKLLPPLVSPASAVLTLQNGLGNEEQLAKLFPKEQILGGLCFVCLNRTEPGVVHHIAHGQVVLGEFAGWPEPRTHDVAGAFRHAGIPCKVSDNLAQAHWEKLTWNIPFNGLGVAGIAGLKSVLRGHLDETGDGLQRRCLPTDQLLADPGWTELLRELMLEVITAARALGYDLPERVLDEQFERTRNMGPYQASTLLDYERSSPLELNSLFLEPLRQAKQAGVAVPRLSALCSILRELDALKAR